MPHYTRFLSALALTAAAAFPAPAAAQSPDQVNAFLANIRAHCGKAYEGRMVNPMPGDSVMARARLVMHVRECGDTVRVPFHVGEDRSRTWVLTRTASGARLKHDHRHADGKPDSVTQYGGDSRATGTAAMMEFAADAFTANLIPAARTNVWTVEISATQFAYRLRREGTERRVNVVFDLTKPVAAPPAPWGHK